MKHSQGEWRIQADPEFVGGHPYHQNRFITCGPAILGTDDWEIDMESRIICKMMDGENQAGDAKLIISSPKLLEVVKDMLACMDKNDGAALANAANDARAIIADLGD